MKTLDSYANIFKRYDLDGEKAGAAQAVSTDPALQKIAQFVVDGDADGILAPVKEILKTKAPVDVINNALIAGMNEVSRLWDEGVYFLPQVILSSDAMNVGIAECECAMGKSMERKGKVVTHTAEGDIHDIGQVIVNALLNANGFEVINLGADVLVDKVVSAVKEHKPVMVTGTALMTTTMTAFPQNCPSAQDGRHHRSLRLRWRRGERRIRHQFRNGDLGQRGRQAPGMAEDALAGESWEGMRGKWNG